MYVLVDIVSSILGAYLGDLGDLTSQNIFLCYLLFGDGSSESDSAMKAVVALAIRSAEHDRLCSQILTHAITNS